MLEIFTALILLSNFLLLFLLCSLLFSEKALDSMAESDDYEAAVTDDDYEAAVTDDETNHHADDQESSSKAESKSNERFLIKIMYEETETVKQWFVPIISGILDIDMNELRNRITSLFGLPRYSKLDVCYHDEDGSTMTINDDNDLEYISMLKMEQLNLYFRVINNATTTQLGGGAGLEPICASKPANIPKSCTASEFEMDDWLLT